MKKNVYDITLMAVMTAIIVVMFLIPGLSFIPLGQINATLGHIPVIIIAIVKGPKMGAMLGLIFGITSLLNSFLRPNVTSFIFMNPIISVFPRIMIGFISGVIYLALKRIKGLNRVGISISAAIGSLTNTIFVLGLIYLLYAKDYIEATNRVGQAAGNVLFAIGSTSGIVEMIVATVIATPIAFTLLKLDKKG